VKLLFAKHSMIWPRSTGHDVYTFYMMKEFAALGHEVSLATVVEPEGHALDGLDLKERIRLDGPGAVDGEAMPGTWLQKRFRSFWGVSDHQIHSLSRAARAIRADAVIVVGLDALPYFPALTDTTRIWYAADEWVLHHLSQLQFRKGQFKSNLHAAMVKGLYERAHCRTVDRAWVVSDQDRKAMQRFAGISKVDILPSGVDPDFFRPGPETVEPRTAVFWGRLDFGPNVQALDWFCRKVWPLIRQRMPDARFTIIGFQPTDEVRALAAIPGITLAANLRDLRSAARRHAVVVLPLVSGAGIKNKLLEAAALGLPIVCTPLATGGLRGQAPLSIAKTPEEFAAAVVALWSDDERRRQAAAAVRSWVVEHHSWLTTARDAIAALEASRAGG
jgi:glycosyltransferase involved in cell wall biosynthesis